MSVVKKKHEEQLEAFKEQEDQSLERITELLNQVKGLEATIQ